MKTDRSGKLIITIFEQLLFVQILAVAVAILGSVIDGIVISNFLGREAMAAFSIATPAFVILACIANVIAYGVQTVCAKALGRGEVKRINGVFTLTMITLLILGIILSLAFYFLSEPIAILLGATEENLPLVVDYVKGLSFGAIAILLNGALVRFLQLDQAALFSFVSVLIMTIVNIVGDILDVKVFNGGMFGMALATSISYFAAVIFCLLHFFRKKSCIKLDFKSVRAKDLGPIISYGFPSAIGQACNGLNTLIINNILLTIGGTLFVSSFSCQSTVATFLQSASLGIGMTALMVLSIIVGEEDRTSLIKVFKKILLIGLIINTCIMVFVLISADWIASIFCSSDAEGLKAASFAIRITAIGFPFSIIGIIFQNYYQSIKKMVYVNIFVVFQNLIFVVLFAFVLPKIFGPNSVWFYFPVSQILSLLLIVIFAAIKNKSFPTNIEKLMIIDSDFGVKDDCKLIFTATSMDEVINISKKVWGFCTNLSITDFRRYISSLAIEELAGNIVKHGFNDNKKHLIEGCLTYKDGKLILKLKDNCRGFNPKKQLEIMDPNDVTSNIGIRIMAKLSQEMNYQSMFRLNVLTIII